MSDMDAQRNRDHRYRRAWNVVLTIGLLAGAAVALAPDVRAATTLNGHVVMLDGSGRLLPWTADPAVAYDTVITNAWDYLLNRVPNDPATGRPAYLSQSYLNPDTQQMAGWPSNPAGMFAMVIESALAYYGYSGDVAVITLARSLADQVLSSGLTRAGDNWSSVPYACGDAGSVVYDGADYGNTTGVGDGNGYIEPDKLGELGFSFLRLYEATGATAYRDAAAHWADVLAAHIRPGNAGQSPWPFRVQAADGAIRQDYTADTIGPISLFDELLRLGVGATASYQSARQTAWSWLMAYPMQSNNWANYFEDVPVSSTNNYNQYNALMTARYLLLHPELDASWLSHVRGIIAWVEAQFATTNNTATAIKEQVAFAFVMGSHTSRYASVNALLYARTGDTAAREKAYRSLNWATYMARSNGIDIDGPDVNNQWFTDGYGDYIRHFLVAMSAIPEWAPPAEDHLTGTTSTIAVVHYTNGDITYTTADTAAVDTLRLSFVPTVITIGGRPAIQRTDLAAEGYTFDTATLVLRIRHDTAPTVHISGGQTTNIPPTVTLTTPTDGTTLTAPVSIPWSAQAHDADGSVTRVDFYDGDVLIGTTAVAPYSGQWSNVAAGSHVVTALATDDEGASTRSAPAVVIVSSPTGTNWQSSDIGAVGVAGSTSASNGVFTVKASGADVWDTADSFRYVFVPLVGDGEIRTRVVTQQNTDPWALGGVMIRETLSPSARHATVALTPANGVGLTHRPSTGSTSSYVSGGSAAAPCWVRLSRVGNVFTAFRSANGTTWTQFAQTTITMGSAAYAGLVVASHDNAVLGTVTFDNLSATGASDTTPPVISGVTTGTPSQNGVSVSWATDEAADSRAEYGLTAQYGSTTATNTTLATTHTAVLAGLDADATYHFRVRSRDAAGNEAISGDFTVAIPPTPTTTTTTTTTTTSTTTTSTTTPPPTTTSTTTTSTTAPPPTIVLDGVVTTRQSTSSRSVTSPVFSTAPNALLVAFVASDGGKGIQTFSSVTGGGLTWTLRTRVNGEHGTAEIWTATAALPLASISVTARRAGGSYQGMITVAAFRNAGVGAVAGSHASTGAPATSITTTTAGAWVWAVGNDWDRALARTVGAGQVEVAEMLAPAGDTFWVQRQTSPTATVATVVTMSDVSPTTDRWNLAAIEIVPR